MATVRLMQTGMHVPWKKGEIITMQVGEDLGDGEYTCETLDTYPADLKEQHAAALLASEAAHQVVIDDLLQRLASASEST